MTIWGDVYDHVHVPLSQHAPAHHNRSRHESLNNAHHFGQTYTVHPCPSQVGHSLGMGWRRGHTHLMRQTNKGLRDNGGEELTITYNKNIVSLAMGTLTEMGTHTCAHMHRSI